MFVGLVIVFEILFRNIRVFINDIFVAIQPNNQTQFRERKSMQTLTSKNGKKIFAASTLMLLFVSLFLTVPLTSATALSTVTVTVDNQNAANTTDYSITFTTATSGIVEAIEFIFPDGFDVSSAEKVSVINLGSGQLSNPGDGQTIRYLVDDAVVIPAGRIIAIQLSGIVNTNVAGDYVITVTTRTYEDIIDGPVDSASFTINPSFTVNPKDGPIGTEVDLSGKYFGANKLVTLTFNNQIIGTITTNTSGDFTTTYSIETPLDGPYYFNATTNECTAAAEFWVYSPEFYLYANQGAAGNVLGVEGYGFSYNSTVDIVWELGGSAESFLKTLTVDETGYFEGNITIPDAALGMYKITATDENGNSAYETFEVIEPTIETQNPTGVWGSIESIRGIGFTAFSNVTLVWKVGGSVEVELNTVTVGNSGRFVANFTIPEVASRVYNISAVINGHTVAQTEYEVTDSMIRLNQTRGIVGSKVTVNGEGFKALSQISLTWNGTQIATANADTTGKFNTTIHIPNACTGYHLIAATDEINQISNCTFYVEPTIITNVTEGPVGTLVYANGTGWASSTAFSLHLSPDMLGVKVTQSATDEKGSFSVNFTVPKINADSYFLDLSYDGADFESYNYLIFTVTPQITLTPDSGFVTTIQGTGFTANMDITLTCNETVIPTVPSVIKTDADGNFTAIITLPSSSAATYNITATDKQDNAASAIFTVPDMTGSTGQTGAQGTNGSPGVQGEAGQTGQTGPQGIKGETGDTGPQGSPATEVYGESMLPIASIGLALIALISALIAAFLAIKLQRK